MTIITWRVLKLTKRRIYLYYKGKDYLIFRNSGPMKNKYYLIKYLYTERSQFFDMIIKFGNIGAIYEISYNYKKQYWIAQGNPTTNIPIKIRSIKKAEVLSLMVQNL